MRNPDDGGAYRDSYQDDSDDREDEAADWWKNADGSDGQQKARAEVEARRYSGEEQIYILSMHPRRALALAVAAKALNTTPEALLSAGWMNAMERGDAFEMCQALASYEVPSEIPEIRALRRYGRNADWDWLAEEQVFVDDAGCEERFAGNAEPQRFGRPARWFWEIVQRTLFVGSAANEWRGTAEDLMETLKASASPADLPQIPKTVSWVGARLTAVQRFRPASVAMQRVDGIQRWTIRRSC